MKRILITTDFSANSKHTIEYVLDFLHDTKILSEILLVNTFMVQQTDPLQVIRQNDEFKMRSRAGLEKEKSEALKKINNSNISVNTSSHMGTLSNVILQLLKKEKIDLVAMGKDGGRHVETVAALLREKECPLLITYLKE